MKRFFQGIAVGSFSLLLFVLDGQLSALLSHYLPGNLVMKSYFLFMLAIFLVAYVKIGFLLPLFLLLGVLYDSYFLQFLGLGLSLFPLAIFLMYHFYTDVAFPHTIRTLILVVSIFSIEFVSYILARLFHVTSLSLFIFLANQLLPTLLLNVFCFLLFHPLFDRLVGNINKT